MINLRKMLVLLAVAGTLINGGTLNAFSTKSSILNNRCNCVIFRLDDVQDHWLQKQQAEVMDLFISHNNSLTLGLIMGSLGEDTKLLERIKDGTDKGLFELALHGMQHIDYSHIDRDAQISHFLQANNKLKSMTGHGFDVFIPPYNTFNDDTLEAMSKTGITVISADKDYDIHPALVSNQSLAKVDGKRTILHMPESISFAYVQDGKYWKETSVKEILSTIDKDITSQGYAVVTLHPQDLAFQKGDGNFNTTINERKLGDLKILIDSLSAKNIAVRSFSDVVQIEHPRYSLGSYVIYKQLSHNSMIITYLVTGIIASIVIVVKARKDKTTKKGTIIRGKATSPINENHDDMRSIVPVCILIPAYNEENFIGETLESLMNQTVLPKNIIVIDDCSIDRTGEIAKSFGATVKRIPINSGSKANALNCGLNFVHTKYTLAVDADMRPEPKALEEMLNLMESDEDISVASSFILPKQIKNIWERSRFVEYMLSFPLFKKVQNDYNRLVVCPGCFAIYRTEDLKLAGGWSNRTKAEDMDLTWTFYENGKKVKVNQDTFCYASEPGSFKLWRKQVTRWNVGYFEVVSLRMPYLKKTSVLREFVFMSMTDTIVGTAAFIGLATHVAFTSDFAAFFYYLLVDCIFVILIPLYKSIQTNNLQKLLSCLPAYYVTRFLMLLFYSYAILKVFVLKQTVPKFEKGH